MLPNEPLKLLWQVRQFVDNISCWNSKADPQACCGEKTDGQSPKEHDDKVMLNVLRCQLTY